MSTVWAWVKRFLGMDRLERVAALQKRVAHNEGSIEGAINAFKQFAKDAGQ